MLGVMSWVIPIGVALSTFGGANGYTITGPRFVFVICFTYFRLYNYIYQLYRIIYSAARNGHTPSILSMVNAKSKTPAPAIIFNVRIAIL